MQVVFETLLVSSASVVEDLEDFREEAVVAFTAVLLPEVVAEEVFLTDGVEFSTMSGLEETVASPLPEGFSTGFMQDKTLEEEGNWLDSRGEGEDLGRGCSISNCTI